MTVTDIREAVKLMKKGISFNMAKPEVKKKETKKKLER